MKYDFRTATSLDDGEYRRFAADKGPLEFDSRVLGDVVLPLIV